MTPFFRDEMIAALKAEGYVVIPKERHVILTSSACIDRYLVERMQPEEAQRYNNFIKHRHSREIGWEILDKGYGLSVDHGLDPHMDGYRTTYSVGLILPKA